MKLLLINPILYISWQQNYVCWIPQQSVTENYMFFGLAISLALASFLFILILYIRRTIINARNKKIDYLKFRFQYLIYDAMVESQTDKEDTVERLMIEKLKKEVLKTKLHKQVLADLIIDLKQNFSGEAEQQFIQLYQALGLSDFSFKKLHTSRWDAQAKGIRELAEMDYEYYKTQVAIMGLRYVKNKTVAQEAQIASVRIEKKPLLFLYDLQKPLNEWEQINLHHFLLKLDRKFIPDFTQWLSSENESVVQFALKMIADFEQKQAEPSVIDCLEHPSVSVKEEAIRSLLKLEVKKALPQILATCQHCHEQMYLETIEVVDQWRDPDHIILLESLLQHPSALVNQMVRHTIDRLSQQKALKPLFTKDIIVK